MSGTHGLAAAADAIVVLRRARASADGLLQITGRDLPEAEWALRFDATRGSWRYIIAFLDLETWARVDVASPARAYAGVVTSADIADLLRARGHRVTRPRRAVWEALVKASGHLTVEELAGRVREREPGVNLASVYRSLALFEEFDLVRESRLGDDEAGRWEVAHPDDHFHVVCEECGEVDHHVGDLVEQLRDHLETGHGFHTRSVDMTVTGRCARCVGSS